MFNKGKTDVSQKTSSSCTRTACPQTPTVTSDLRPGGLAEMVRAWRRVAATSLCQHQIADRILVDFPD